MGGRGVAGFPRCLFRDCARQQVLPREPRRCRSDRAVLHARKGSLRNRVRARQPAGMGRRSHCAASWRCSTRRPRPRRRARTTCPSAPRSRPRARFAFASGRRHIGRFRSSWTARRSPCNQSARAGTNSSPIALAPVRDIASCCRMGCAFRTRPRAISRTTCMGRARWSIQRPTRGATPAGAGAPGMRLSSTNCTSAPLRRRAPSVVLSACSTIWLRSA